ncbi:hypothetical protein JCM10296v2_001175 [Rhodotorula toruloides]
MSPPCDVVVDRNFVQELKAAQDALSSQAAPKSKFSFRRSATASRSATPAPSAAAPPLPSSMASSSASTSSPIPPTPLTVTSQSDLYLSLGDLPANSSSSAAEALALTSLYQCFVNLALTPEGSTLSYRFSALYLSDIADSVVVLPVISGGSVMFRMHDSTNSLVLLAAGSSPVIERCQGIVFGSYPCSLPNPSSASTATFAIQDFDDPFATPERPSPNWRRAREAEEAEVEAFLRPQQDGWEAARDAALRVADTLSAVAKQ